MRFKGGKELCVIGNLGSPCTYYNPIAQHSHKMKELVGRQCTCLLFVSFLLIHYKFLYPRKHSCTHVLLVDARLPLVHSWRQLCMVVSPYRARGLYVVRSLEAPVVPISGV